MVDTVRVKTSVWASKEVPDGWDATTGETTRIEGRSGEAKQSDWVAFQHRETGLRVYGPSIDEKSWLGMKVECSLPRMVFEHNGFLIRNQEQLDEAQARMWRLVQSLCLPGREAYTGEQVFTRVDLVWQFEGNITHWISDLSRSYHPQVRRAKTIYEGESIHFPGRHRHLRVYDKSKESLGRAGDVVRVELQLSGEPLQRAMTAPKSFFEPVVSLDFSLCYAAYRSFLVKFEGVKRPEIGKMADFLGYCLRNDIRDKEGQSLFEIWARSKTPRAVRRVKREIQNSEQSWAEFSFSKLLPRAAPPPPVDLVAEEAVAL